MRYVLMIITYLIISIEDTNIIGNCMIEETVIVEDMMFVLCHDDGFSIPELVEDPDALPSY